MIPMLLQFRRLYREADRVCALERGGSIEKGVDPLRKGEDPSGSFSPSAPLQLSSHQFYFALTLRPCNCRRIRFTPKIGFVFRVE